eukprot:7134961-Lingulodinium_polyedra.AAC.1
MAHVDLESGCLGFFVECVLPAVVYRAGPCVSGLPKDPPPVVGKCATTALRDARSRSSQVGAIPWR